MFKDSILYPMPEKTMDQLDQPFLKLDPKKDEDRWFIMEIGAIPKPEGEKYDFMQFQRLLTLQTLFTLDSESIMTSQYLRDVNTKTFGDLKELLQAIYFLDAFDGDEWNKR